MWTACRNSKVEKGCKVPGDHAKWRCPWRVDSYRHGDTLVYTVYVVHTSTHGYTCRYTRGERINLRGCVDKPAVSCVLRPSVQHSCVTEHFAAGTTHSVHVSYPSHPLTYTRSVPSASLCLFLVRLSIDFDYYYRLYSHRALPFLCTTGVTPCITERPFLSICLRGY